MNKKITAIALATLLGVAPFAGCGKSGGKNLPKDKTIISLLCYDAGYGRTYVEKVTQAFTEELGKPVNTSSLTADVGDQVIS